jgi:RNA polymerase sigma-70 factor (ECF subfamily)
LAQAEPVAGPARPDAVTRDWHDDDTRWAGWMAAAQRGDKAAYEKLLTEVAATIRRYLHVRFGPADFIDDITQECLLSIHKGRHTYDAGRPFRAWLFAIVRHRSIDYLRRSGSDKAAGAVQLDIDRVGPEQIDPDCQTHAVSDVVATAAEASLILSQLSREHRDIIVRTKYLGYSAGEVGMQLGISVAAVRVRLHRALRHARRLFLV